MTKNNVALTVYRTVRAANDDGSSAASVSSSAVSPHLPLAGRSGWYPFEVWRTRIRAFAREPRDKR